MQIPERPTWWQRLLCERGGPNGEHLTIPSFTVPSTAQSWGDIARANRNDGPLDDEIVYEDILDAEILENGS